jgi:hypothetical protein
MLLSCCTSPAMSLVQQHRVLQWSEQRAMIALQLPRGWRGISQQVHSCVAVVAASLLLQVHCGLRQDGGRVSLLGGSGSAAAGLLGGACLGVRVQGSGLKFRVGH